MIICGRGDNGSIVRVSVVLGAGKAVLARGVIEISIGKKRILRFVGGGSMRCGGCRGCCGYGYR